MFIQLKSFFFFFTQHCKSIFIESILYSIRQEMSHFYTLAVSFDRQREEVCRVAPARCGRLVETRSYLVQLLHYKATIPKNKLVQFFFFFLLSFFLFPYQLKRGSPDGLRRFKVFQCQAQYCIQNKTEERKNDNPLQKLCFEN